MNGLTSGREAQVETMNPDVDLRRSQVYGFLSAAFLYPQENWTQDAPVVEGILRDLGGMRAGLPQEPLELADLQQAHRRTFGVAGPLCYETEYGLPHEFRQSQELADLNGFYRAFGFTIGGPVRERPDHLAVELEFMHVLALKACLAAEKGDREQAERCQEAQRVFLGDHLILWMDAFPERISHVAVSGPYPALARFAAEFIKDDAARMGVAAGGTQVAGPTPFDPDPSCEGCPASPERG